MRLRTVSCRPRTRHSGARKLYWSAAGRRRLGLFLVRVGRGVGDGQPHGLDLADRNGGAADGEEDLAVLLLDAGDQTFGVDGASSPHSGVQRVTSV